MATPQPSSTPTQPKIVQTLLKRTATVLLAFAAIFGGLRYVQEQKGDFDRGGESSGMIAAIRIERNGQQAVLIKPDGTVVGTKSWKDGNTDREAVWSPDGRFLFFCSDRKENTFNVFRWNPQSDDAQKRTETGGSRANPTFAPGGTGDTLLVVAGGFVRELDPKTGKTPQILPPVNAEIAQSGGGDESGTEGSLSIYGNLGKSFRIARYLPGKGSIAAVMRREDGGEILVLQELTPVNGKVPKPRPIVAGDHVEFDIDPTSGSVVYCVQNFRWPDKDQVPPQFRQGNRVTTPFRNAIGLVDPKGAFSLVGASANDAAGFGAPRVSPDGTKMLLVAGRIEEGSLRPAALLTLPLRAQGMGQAAVLTKGDVYEPSWSADGNRIAYAKRVGGKRDIYTMAGDGTDETNVTKGQGDFSTPLMSPMVK